MTFKYVNLYDYLLEQLILFEQAFGAYIFNQYNENQEYIEKSKYLINKIIINTEELITISSFNYSKLDYDYFENIYGDVYFPIFGINSSNILNTDTAYVFTKAYRKLKLEINHNYALRTNYLIFNYLRNIF